MRRSWLACLDFSDYTGAMASKYILRPSIAFAAMIALSACGSQRPILYPNAKYNQSDPAQVQRDIDDCMRMAEQFEAGSSNTKAKGVARDTAIGAGSGAAIGAAGGAVSGHAGRGAATGAATGATAGLLHGLFRASEPSGVYKNFVQRCLSERGYQTIGWE
jgi:outer membrane lipoprotein SlyB